jgi:hypothetical protein
MSGPSRPASRHSRWPPCRRPAITSL